MNQKKRIVIIAIAFALLVGAAYLLYDRLSKNMDGGNQLMTLPQDEEGQQAFQPQQTPDNQDFVQLPENWQDNKPTEKQPLQPEATTPSSQPTQPEATTPPTQPTQPEATTPPTQPTQPEATTPPTQPTQPEATTPPTQPTQPEATTPPTQPTQPEATTPPTQPTQPEATTPPTQPTEPKPLPPALDITVYDAEGNPVNLANYAGKPIVLNFWASWCGPCQREMPAFQEVFQELEGQVQFLMVNMTTSETVSSAKSFIESNGYTFPVFYDTQGDAATAYSVRSLPTTYFLNAEGQKIAYAIGSIDKETLLKGIDMVR